MKKITLFLALLMVSFVFAQTVLEDFEGAAPAVQIMNDNGGAVTIEVDPEAGGTHGNVMKMVTSSAAESWAQAELIMQGQQIDLTAASTDGLVTVDIYSLTQRTFFAKVVAGTGGDSAGDSTSGHTGSGWETISFDFTVGRDGTGAADGVYSQIYFFPFRDVANDGWFPPEAGEWYFDNITAVGADAAADATLPASASPAVPASITAGTDGTDYISIFSDDLTNITVDNFNPGWGQATSASVIENEGDNILRYANLNYQGTTFNNDKQDVSGMGFLHLDYHTTNATALQFFLIDDTGESAYDIQLNEGITSGSWVSLDIPVSNWTTPLTSLREIKVVGDGTIYFDNWYFYGAATASIDKNNLSNVSLYPSPAQNELTISAENTIQNVTVYNVLGRKVQSFNVNATSKKLDVSSLSTGIYILKYTANNVVGSMKFIKE